LHYVLDDRRVFLRPLLTIRVRQPKSLLVPSTSSLERTGRGPVRPGDFASFSPHCAILGARASRPPRYVERTQGDHHETADTCRCSAAAVRDRALLRRRRKDRVSQTRRRVGLRRSHKSSRRRSPRTLSSAAVSTERSTPGGGRNACLALAMQAMAQEANMRLSLTIDPEAWSNRLRLAFELLR